MASDRDLDRVFIEMATIFGSLSKAKRRHVGCIIVKDGQIISNGFNGTPSGFDNNCEDIIFTKEGITTITKPEVLHAESNALMKLTQSTNSSRGATMYVTCMPCFECSKLIIQSGIKRVVYAENYRDTKGVELLKKVNIIVDNYE